MPYLFLLFSSFFLLFHPLAPPLTAPYPLQKKKKKERERIPLWLSSTLSVPASRPFSPPLCPSTSSPHRTATKRPGTVTRLAEGVGAPFFPRCTLSSLGAPFLSSLYASFYPRCTLPLSVHAVASRSNRIEGGKRRERRSALRVERGTKKRDRKERTTR